MMMLQQTHFRFRTDTDAVDAAPTWADLEDEVDIMQPILFDVSVGAITSTYATPYSAGDIMGGLLTFALPAGNEPAIKIESVQIVSKVAVAPSFTLVLFDADPTNTTKTDNEPYSLNYLDAFKVRAALPLNSMGAVFVDHGTPNSWILGNLDLSITPDGNGNIYGLLIDNTGVTLSGAADIQVTLSGGSS